MAQLGGLLLLGLFFSMALLFAVAIFRGKLPFSPKRKWQGIGISILITLVCGMIAGIGSWNVFGIVGVLFAACWILLTLFGAFWLAKRWKPVPVYQFLDWPLAASALLSREKKWTHDHLLGEEATAKSQKKARNFLQNEWDITGTDEWVATCEWLIETGQRKQFHQEIDALLSLDEAELAAYLSQIDQGEVQTEDGATAHELHARAYWVVEEGFELLEKSFLAWDLLRMIDISRWAYLAGWADTEQVTAYLFLAGQALQKRYRSWEELNSAYLNGMRYWSYDAFQQGEPKREKHLQYLRAHKSSPWKRIPWQFELPTPDFGGDQVEGKDETS